MADRVMLRGVAWSTFGTLTAAGTAIGVVAVALTSLNPMLLMVCSALLASGAAFLLDEPASAVADVTASRGRQTQVRARLLAIPLALSGVLIAVSPQDDVVRRPGLFLAFTGALLLAFAVARCLREATGLPGSVAATVSIVVCVIPAVLGRFSPIQTFPGTGEGEPVIGSDLWWTVSDVVCAAAVGALTVAMPLARVLRSRRRRAV
jgi:hypothetical protein